MHSFCVEKSLCFQVRLATLYEKWYLVSNHWRPLQAFNIRHIQTALSIFAPRILFQETSQLVRRLSLPFFAIIKKEKAREHKKVQSIKDAFFSVANVEDKVEMLKIIFQGLISYMRFWGHDRQVYLMIFPNKSKIRSGDAAIHQCREQRI